MLAKHLIAHYINDTATENEMTETNFTESNLYKLCPAAYQVLYIVVDTKTGCTVRQIVDDKPKARAIANSMDRRYGAARYSVRVAS